MISIPTAARRAQRATIAGIVVGVAALLLSFVPFQAAQSASNLIVSGTAVDESTGQPVDVLVSDGYGGSSDLSDESGHFSFPVQPGQHSLMFRYPGSLDGHGHLFLITDPIEISSDLALGTVTLPSLRGVNVTVTDQHGVVLDNAYFSASTGMGADSGWTDSGDRPSPMLSVAYASWEVNTPSRVGGTLLRIPMLADTDSLPGGSVRAYTQSGAVFAADLRDAVKTGVGSVSLAIDGFDAPLPSAPDSVFGYDDGHSLMLQWHDFGGDGKATAAKTGYTITASPGGQTWTVSPEEWAAEITDIAPGTYTFTVTTESVAGSSAPSAPTSAITVRRIPGPVGKPSATVKGHKVTVSWDAPEARGATITGYEVVVAPTVKKGKNIFPSTRAVYKDLAPGRYSFRVRALTDQKRVTGAFSPAVSVRVKR